MHDGDADDLEGVGSGRSDGGRSDGGHLDDGRSDDERPLGRFDLGRFVAAQDAGGTYARALDELRAGRKTSHWIWFVLPQVAGLGTSETSRRYALSGLEEARAYLAHPVLGPRLREAVAALDAGRRPDPVAVLGPVDAVKVRSSMTLFARAAPDEPLFTGVLDAWFGGVPDRATLDRL